MLHIIESKSYDVSDADKLKDAITNCGQSYVDVDYVRLIQLFGDNGPRENFVFWGSIGMSRRLDQMYKATLPEDYYRQFSKYQNRSKNFTPNSECAMSYREFISEMGDQALNAVEGAGFFGYWQLGNMLPILGHRKYFVRPVSGDKLFHGGVFDLHEEYQRDKWLSIFGKIPNDTEIFIAPAQEITNEYRFFVRTGIPSDKDCPSRIISGSRYIHNGEITIDTEGVESASKYLANLLNNPPVTFRPPLLRWLVIDIAESSSGEFSLLECNNYTTSAFYAADAAAIVKAFIDEHSNSRE